MQSDINNSKFPGMWLTVGKMGIILYARFHGDRTVLSVMDRYGLWWDFGESEFVHEKVEYELKAGELAQYIKFFTFYGEKSHG